jgi:hypothetical protein
MTVRVAASCLGILLVILPAAGQTQSGSIDLFADGLSAFRPVKGKTEWEQVGGVALDEKNPRRLLAQPGQGVWYNGPKGRTNDLFTQQKFGDVEVHLEFNVPKGSNSGIKLHGHYEIQIDDSYGRKEVSGENCGGIYPRAELKPNYHHIDKGIPPRVNACKAPGEWQTLDIVFLAPRFDADAKKSANAKIAKALLNGQVIHEDQELKTPTGDRYKNAEMREGPIMLQGDHGPVAFRNVRVRPLP